jgi:oxygen-independent coproporphyrinogen III oxidase
MAGIYIHIPFCKQACYYCNFHFVTSLRHKNELVAALLREIELRKEYLGNEVVETVYFGGGTPSLLQIADLRLQIGKLKQVFSIGDHTEITMEVNPDDITEESLVLWKDAGINRLSIGVQSFFEDDLQWMNRAHSAEQAISSLQLAKKYFDNISIDLIYGTPGLTDEKWKQNVSRSVESGITHLSCYALTVELKTPLHKMIRENKTADVDADKQSQQFLLLMQWMKDEGYEHYEISNFSRPGHRSRHNTSYWQGKKYLGLGPSAHSFNSASRQWNVSNNNQYIESIGKGIVPFDIEELTATQKTNEYIMTSLRTMEGLDITKLEESIRLKILSISKKYLDAGLMIQKGSALILTNEGKLLADGIAAALFVG